MATSSTYYIDTADFSTATAVWTDTALTTKAPDGYYSFGGNYRQQFEGLLLSIIPCGSAPTYIIVTGVGGGFEPCIGSTVDDYLSAGITLDNVVSVDTLFSVDINYIIDGGSCSVTPSILTHTFDVLVPAGEFTGQIDACTQGFFVDGGGVICSACVNSYSGNTVDTISLGAWTC